MQPAIDHGIRVIRELGKKMFSFEHLSKNVESGLYAATIKGILLYHLNVTKRVVTYGNLAVATQSLPKGGQLAQALEKIAEDDHLNKRTISTAVVVNEKTGMPGAGFFNQCRQLGHPVPRSPEGELLFWKQLLNHLDVLPFGGEESSIDPSILRQAAGNRDVHTVGEVGILEGMWRSPEAGDVDRQPVPDISLHPEIKDLRDKAANKSRARAFPHILIEKQEDKVVGTVADRGVGVHRTPPEHQFKNNPGSCVHANEAPNVCPCHETCYCKTRTCKTKADETLVTALMGEAIPREKELGRQVEQEEDAEQRRTILAKNLKEGDVVLLIEPLKEVKVSTVEPRLMIEGGGKTRWVIDWTDTEGVRYSCADYTHLNLRGSAPKEPAPSSKLP
jgi:hypothetical protein